MRGLLYLLILFIGLVSCSKSSTSDSDLLTDPSTVYRHQGESHFKFTSRGVEYDARSNGKEDPLNNLTTLQYNPESGNRLDIVAFDADSPADQSIRTGLLITVYLGDREMKKGAYQFVSTVEAGDCKLRKFEGCDAITSGTISPHKYEDDFADKEYSISDVLYSVSGELEITEFHLGKFVGGMAEGTISGHFFYDGYALESRKENPGSASGKFENVKVIAQQFD